jgi:hypothetical protein
MMAWSACLHRGTTLLQRTAQVVRVTGVLLTSLSAVAVFATKPAPVVAEDTCVAAAPLTASDITGHTWSGTVVGIRQVGTDDVGTGLWSIVFGVDRVYAHLPDHEFPPGATLSPGVQFDLPSDDCGRRGDMAMVVGGRYLVSTAFVGEGTFIGNLAAWEVHGENVLLVPGLYRTSNVGGEIQSAQTVAQVLEFLRIMPARPTDLNSYTPSPEAQPNSGDQALYVWIAAGLIATIATLAGLASLQRVRNREGMG